MKIHNHAIWSPDYVKGLVISDAIEKFQDIAIILAKYGKSDERNQRFLLTYKPLKESESTIKSALFNNWRFISWVDEAWRIMCTSATVEEFGTCPEWHNHLYKFSSVMDALERRNMTASDKRPIGSKPICSGGLVHLMGDQDRSALVDWTENSNGRAGSLGENGEESVLRKVIHIGATDEELKIAGDSGYTALGPEQIDYAAWQTLIDVAWKEITKHDGSTKLIRTFIDGVVPIQNDQEEVHLSSSCRDLPGFVFASYPRTTADFAEALVHEADHQLLYGVYRRHRLVDSFGVHTRYRFRSPWRKDGRPIEGLLFGASAFVRVAAFWASIAKDHQGVSLEKCGRRATLAILQSQDALNTIKTYAQLTEVGESLVRILDTSCELSLSVLAKYTSFATWRDAAAHQMDSDIALFRAENGFSDTVIGQVQHLHRES